MIRKSFPPVDQQDFDVMIAFAFVPKEESRIVGHLNHIIQNYQEFQIGAPPKERKG